MAGNVHFDPDALEVAVASLDHLPRGLWLRGIVNSVGCLSRRLHGLVALRKFLIAGLLPAAGEADWPSGPAGSAFISSLGKLRFADYCRYSEELRDHVVRSLLWHADRIIHRLDRMSESEAAARAADDFHADRRIRADQMEHVLYVFDDIGDAINFDRWDETRGPL